MINYSVTTTINKPAEQVFQYIADVSRYSEWMEVRDAKIVGSEMLRVGSKMEMTLKMGPISSPIAFEVAAYEPNRRMFLKTVSEGAIHWDADLKTEPLSDTSTRVTNIGEIGLRGFWRIFEPLMAGEVKSGEQKELEKIKYILESH